MSDEPLSSESGPGICSCGRLHCPETAFPLRPAGTGQALGADGGGVAAQPIRWCIALWWRDGLSEIGYQYIYDDAESRLASFIALCRLWSQCNDAPPVAMASFPYGLSSQSLELGAGAPCLLAGIMPVEGEMESGHGNRDEKRHGASDKPVTRTNTRTADGHSALSPVAV